MGSFINLFFFEEYDIIETVLCKRLESHLVLNVMAKLAIIAIYSTICGPFAIHDTNLSLVVSPREQTMALG